MNFDLGIRAGYLLSMKAGSGQVEQNFFIGIQNGEIAEVSPFRESHSKTCTRFLDFSDQIVMPGLVNSHTHLAMSLFRGFEDDVPFREWLYERIFPVEAKVVDEEFVRVGTELSALESIRFGTTTVNDMHFYCEATAQILDRAGMRAQIGWPFFDFDVPGEKVDKVRAFEVRAERFEAFYRNYENHPRITPAIGPHSPYSCSDELIRLVTRLSKQFSVAVHMHVSETHSEIQDSIKKHGKRPVERLADLGALHDRFIAAHCVHLDEKEVDLFRKFGATVIYNPDSNMKLGSGVAPIAKYRKQGIKVGLGTDGAASNNDLSMFGAMDLGTKLQKSSAGDSTAMIALDALNLATYEGAHAIGLGKKIGSIEPGKRADIISLRTDLPHVKPLYSVLSQLVYAYQGLEVDTVICDGRVLLDRQKYQTLDDVAIFEKVELIRQKVKDELEAIIGGKKS